jgi:hypothetical protein
MHCARTFIAFFLLSALAIGADSSAEKQGAEVLVPLKAGKDATGVVSYGLFCPVNDSRADRPAGSDMVLVLRNIGAKNISMQNAAVTDFNLRDQQGKDIKIYLWGAPRGIAYGEMTVAHVHVDNPYASQPWTMHYKSKPNAVVPFELTIDGIVTDKK